MIFHIDPRLLWGNSHKEMFGSVSQLMRFGMYQGWGQVQLTKYSSTPSTPNIYQVQVLVKYSFFKYLSTSSTFISSTSTHIQICSKVRMDIQSRVNFGWTK